MKKIIVIVAVGLIALMFAVPASAAVKKVAFTQTVNSNSYATVKVAVTPAARCSIAVEYSSGPSKAQGLGIKSGRNISWTWKVGSRTKAGVYPVTVSCGKSGILRLKIRVR